VAKVYVHRGHQNIVVVDLVVDGDGDGRNGATAGARRSTKRAC
jgi:hypothetical protein